MLWEESIIETGAAGRVLWRTRGAGEVPRVMLGECECLCSFGGGVGWRLVGAFAPAGMGGNFLVVLEDGCGLGGCIDCCVSGCWADCWLS
jgi:hypothetical protein